MSVYVGSTAVGQDLETVMAQIAADTLGLPLGQVRVLHGSTPLIDEATARLRHARRCSAGRRCSRRRMP